MSHYLPTREQAAKGGRVAAGREPSAHDADLATAQAARQAAARARQVIGGRVAAGREPSRKDVDPAAACAGRAAARQAHCARIAPMGFTATATRYGRHFALEVVARWQRTHPPASEIWVCRQLEAWGYRHLTSYWHQVETRLSTRAGIVDLIVEVAEDRYLAIQPGAWRFHNSATDLAFDARLWAEYAIPTLRLDAAVIRRAPEEATRQLWVVLQALAGGHAPSEWIA